MGYSFRYNPAIQALKRDLVSGRLGTPWLIELAEHNPQFHPAAASRSTGKATPRPRVPARSIEYGSHVVDLAGYG